MKRSTESVTHKHLAELAEPSGGRFKELKTTDRRPLSRSIWMWSDFVAFLKRFSPRCDRGYFHVLLRMFFGVQMKEIIFGGFRKNVAHFAPVKFRIVNDVIELQFSEEKFEILWGFFLFFFYFFHSLFLSFLLLLFHTLQQFRLDSLRWRIRVAFFAFLSLFLPLLLAFSNQRVQHIHNVSNFQQLWRNRRLKGEKREC